MEFSREDREDLARVLIADNPLTQARERAREKVIMPSLLEADDRMLGISREVKVKRKTIYTWLFIDEDKEYTAEELKYRQWMINQLIDNDDFMESFSFRYSLGSHKTKYFEYQYMRYFRSNPKKQFKQLVEE